jgi:hypothetical protein
MNLTISLTYFSALQKKKPILPTGLKFFFQLWKYNKYLSLLLMLYYIFIGLFLRWHYVIL